MSRKEVNRLQVIQRTADNRRRQAVAAQQLGVSVRHVKRLGHRYRHEAADEKCHGVGVSRKTLRQWLIAAGVWQPHRRRAPRVPPHHPRRPCVGELLQIDDSPHAWCEDRASACTLLGFIDDATSRLMALRFVPTETTQPMRIRRRPKVGPSGRTRPCKTVWSRNCASRKSLRWP